MRHFNKITIIGVGLIGGSIGLAVKRQKLAKEVVGVFRHLSTLKRALKYRAITKGTMDLREGVKNADLIIIATPVYSIPGLVSVIVRYAKKGAIITDVGSTKSWIVREVEDRLDRLGAVSFIGSHPMAGSEHAGVEFARSDLLEGSPCIVTKTRKSNPRALATIVSFWESLGAKVKVMDPVSHDRTTSLISHLPHIIAFSLVGAIPQGELKYAAEGFRDTTRVASSDPFIWADIFLTNKKEVTRSIRAFEKSLKGIRKVLAKAKYRELVGLLMRIKAKRDKFIHGK